MRTAHCCVNNGKFPDEEHFNAFMENILDALEDMSVSQRDIDKVVKKVQSFKRDILGLDDECDKNVDSSGLLEKENPKAGRSSKKPIMPVKKCIVSQPKSQKDEVVGTRDDGPEGHPESSSFGSSRKETLELISNRSDAVDSLNIRGSLESNSFLKKLSFDDQCISATGGYTYTSEEFGSLRRQQSADEVISSGSGLYDSRGASSILNTRKAEDES